jgi:hypothetical protein
MKKETFAIKSLLEKHLHVRFEKTNSTANSCWEKIHLITFNSYH